MHQAFILGAGLGTRLRPLTERLPKPLIPLFHRPLAAWAIDACRAVGARRFAINTHHLPDAWSHADFGLPIDYFHEPILLETGGGLKNLEPWIENGPLLVHNGDIFSTLPLEKLIASHEASGFPVTLALRSSGDARHIALDPTATRVTDIREKLGKAPGTHVFTGIYCISRDFLGMLPPHEKVSVIPAFLQLAEMGRLGAVVLDEGLWMDLGDRASYLAAHRELALGPAIHPAAEVSPSAVIRRSVIGPGTRVGDGAQITDCVVWPNSIIAPGTRLENCIVYSETPVAGNHRDQNC